MQFTDIFIRRPVLASVVSLLILVLGLRAYAVLPILQFPRTENALVTVTTIYYGADPDVVAGFITTPLENAIAQANGIDYMNSVAKQRQHDHGDAGLTTTDKALTEIHRRVRAQQLPPGTCNLTVKIG
jgi:multidrug efflux pump